MPSFLMNDNEWNKGLSDRWKNDTQRQQSELRIASEIVPVRKLREELSQYGYEAVFPHKFQGDNYPPNFPTSDLECS